MRIPKAVIFCVLFAIVSFAQEKELPEILRPDPVFEAEARKHGFEVFKILPRGMFEGPFNAYKDEENPLGIREGGAHYSFSTLSHSYNRIPQIGLEKKWMSAGGFYGTNYGFLYDLGPIPLSDVSLDDRPAKVLSEYSPPKLEVEIRTEQRRSHKYELNGNVFVRRLEPTVGNTYLLRAISFREADKMVALHVIAEGPDGSLTIVWRTLKDFRHPRIVDQNDVKLHRKLAFALAGPRFEGVEFSVSEGIVTLTGSIPAKDYGLMIMTVNVTGIRGIRNEVIRK